eukprot:5035372-Lingulodinium_polyedra.AAC.1
MAARGLAPQESALAQEGGSGQGQGQSSRGRQGRGPQPADLGLGGLRVERPRARAGVRERS